MKKVLNNPLIRHSLILVLGVAIGAIFYPTKHIEREIEQKYQSKIQRIKEESKFKEVVYKDAIDKQIALSIKIERESNEKISSLKIENNSLKQKVKERKLKIVKPDGTVVEESFRESETEAVSRVITDVRQEFNTKVKSIENKWKKVHEKRVVEIKEKYEKKLEEKQKIIAEYKKKESIKVNPRSFGLAAGVMSDNQYYGNISYDVFGPLFLNLQIESDRNFQDSSGGIGLGFRF